MPHRMGGIRTIGCVMQRVAEGRLKISPGLKEKEGYRDYVEEQLCKAALRFGGANHARILTYKEVEDVTQDAIIVTATILVEWSN